MQEQDKDDRWVLDYAGEEAWRAGRILWIRSRLEQLAWAGVMGMAGVGAVIVMVYVVRVLAG